MRLLVSIHHTQDWVRGLGFKGLGFLESSNLIEKLMTSRLNHHRQFMEYHCEHKHPTPKPRPSALEIENNKHKYPGTFPVY